MRDRTWAARSGGWVGVAIKELSSWIEQERYRDITLFAVEVRRRLRLVERGDRLPSWMRANELIWPE